MKSRFIWSALASTIAGACICTVSSDVAAANEIGLGASYDARAPLGSFRTSIKNTSFAGLQVKWDFFPMDVFALGFEVQYNLFERGEATETVTRADAAITGTSFHYATFWSFLPTARYYLFARNMVRPYAELGVGATFVTSALLISDQPQRDTSPAFIVQPSVGVLVRLTPDRRKEELAERERELGPDARQPLESMFGLTASVTYAYTTADVLTSNNVSYAGFQVGIYAKP
jgi:opacity protein-like surface antigen